MLNRKAYQYIRILAQEGSFSRAAESLGISQPSLSQYVIKLEKQLGAALFDRGGGEVKLTEAGRLVLDTAAQIEELERSLEIQLADLAEDKKGSLTVGTAPFRCAAMMPQIVKRFHRKYPGISVIIREGTTRELIEGLEQGVYDLCVSVLPVDEDLFAWKKVMEEEILLAVPADQPLPAVSLPDRAYPAVSVQVLNDLPFVSLTKKQVMQQLRDRLCAEYGLTLRTAATVKSLEAQLAMVQAGVGAALLPEGIQALNNKDGVRYYSLAEKKLTRDVAVIWRKNRQLSRRARAFMQVIGEEEA